MKALFLVCGLGLVMGSTTYAVDQEVTSNSSTVAAFTESKSLGNWYCKRKSVHRNKWQRCSSDTGQCIPPIFDEQFQCEAAIPRIRSWEVL